MTELFLNGKVELRPGDCREVLKAIPDNSIDSVVTDPPYALVSIVKRFGGENAKPTKDGDVYSRSSSGFMGKQWDTGETAFAVEFWREVYRVLKPGGHVASFGGTRSHHRMWIAIEGAGLEIRDSILDLFDLNPIVGGFFDGLSTVQQDSFLYIVDQIIGGGMGAWTYGQGFNKKGYIKDERGNRIGPFGGALKPAWEPICLARKPLSEKTVAANVLKWGTGALNIDGCRIEAGYELSALSGLHTRAKDGVHTTGLSGSFVYDGSKGRWPANVCHDGSPEVLAGFPNSAGQQGNVTGLEPSSLTNNVYGEFNGRPATKMRGDSGSAARFFYTAKADAEDRFGSRHPTVKPVDLMQWLVRLITPPGGVTLDPFAGSGTTGEAAWLEGFRAILVERETDHCDDIRYRLAHAFAGSKARKKAVLDKKKPKSTDEKIGGLFAGKED